MWPLGRRNGCPGASGSVYRQSRGDLGQECSVLTVLVAAGMSVHTTTVVTPTTQATCSLRPWM